MTTRRGLSKVEIPKAVKLSRFGKNEWLQILCNIFQRWRRGNDEECKLFLILFLVNDYLHFFKEASKSNPLLV